MSALAQRLRLAGSWYSERAIPATTAVLAGSAVALFVFAFLTGGVDPGSSIGLGLGIAAAVALAAVMLYSVRRALVSVRRLGRTQTYLQMHIWGGALFLLLFFLHTAFRIPSGWFTGVLWITSLWVVGTGGLGLLLQRWVPRVLRPSASFEVHLRRIPELVGELRGRAEAAVADAEPRVRAFYEEEMAADFARPRYTAVALFGEPGALQSRSRDIALLRRTLDPEDAAALDQLREIQGTKQEMDVHYTLQTFLRGWLYLHLPFAVMLLGLVVLHIFFTTWF